MKRASMGWEWNEELDFGCTMGYLLDIQLEMTSVEFERSGIWIKMWESSV